MAQSVTWMLPVGSSLADFVSTTVLAAGGSEYQTAGVAGQWIWFSNGPDPIAFAGDGHSLVAGSTAKAVSFYATPGDPAVISVTGISASLFEFYGTQLTTSPQDAIDWLFGTVVGAGSAYLGGSGAQVLEPFGTGDALVGNAGDDVFELGRIAGVTGVASVHGDGSDGTGLGGSDTIRFVGNYAGSIDVVTQIDRIVFAVAAAPVFKLSGTASWLPSSLIVEVAPEATAMTVQQSTASAADFDFSGWDVSGGTLSLTINTKAGDFDDVVRSVHDWEVATTIDTFDGDDTILGGDGEATIAGGAGQDVLSYTWQTDHPIQVFMESRVVIVGLDVLPSSHNVFFSGIEDFRGTAKSDQFIGDGAGMTFEGMGDSDLFHGVAGSDVISYAHETEFGGTLGIVVNLRPDPLSPSGALPSDVDAAGRAALIDILVDDAPVVRRHIRDSFGASDSIATPVFIIEGSTRPDFMLGDAASDTLRGFGGDDWIYGEANGDRLFGEEGADRLFGGAGADLLSGGNGNDTIEGAAGSNDGLGAGLGDTLQGDGGTDTVTYARASAAVTANLTTPSLNRGEAWHDLYGSIENLVGSAFGDTLTGNAQANLIVANAGNDTLTGNGGADKLRGGAGDDTYFVSLALTDIDESAPGSNGTDTVRSSVTFSLSTVHVKGAVENLVLTNTSAATNGTGNGSANVLDGSLTARANSLIGLGGNDTYILGTGDTADETGGSGVDTIRTAQSFSLVPGARLKGNVENLVLTGSGNASATGNALANSLTGNSGANTLSGGLGKDRLAGGGGSDVFLFNSSLGSANVDTLADFAKGRDLIHLDNAVMAGLGATGALTSAKFYAHAGASHGHDSSDRVVYDTATGRLYYDADGSGGGLAQQIAVFTSLPELDAGSFRIL